VHTVYTVHTDKHIPIQISQTDPRPMYLQIKEQLRHRIAVGELKPGNEIPSIRALAVATQVSVITIKRAYLELELEGVILTRQGRGCFVAENANLGAHMQAQELDQQLSAAVHTAALLGIRGEALVERLRAIERRLSKREP
jgi:GntR family transcriptional regulator